MKARVLFGTSIISIFKSRSLDNNSLDVFLTSLTLIAIALKPTGVFFSLINSTPASLEDLRKTIFLSGNSKVSSTVKPRTSL